MASGSIVEHLDVLEDVGLGEVRARGRVETTVPALGELVAELSRPGELCVGQEVGTMAYLAAGSAAAAAGAGHFGRAAEFGDVAGDWLRVLPMWALVVSLAREFLITALRGLVESNGMNFPADRFGKLKFVLQVVYLATALAGGSTLLSEDGLLAPLAFVRDTALFPSLLLAMMALTVVSGIHYVTRGARMLSGGEG